MKLGPDKTFAFMSNNSPNYCAFFYADDGLPGDINVTEVTTSSIAISWTESTVPITNYEVQIEEVASGNRLPGATVTNPPFTHNFQNLSPGVNYRINVHFTGTDPLVTRTLEQRTSEFLKSLYCICLRLP